MTLDPVSQSSMPLLVRDSSTSASFTQQGSVDWVALSRGTLGFTVQGISRLSQAGIEALTVIATRGIFSQVRLGTLGQSRIEQAIKSVEVFPSMNKALWFGFGIKHIVRNLSETAEGLACVGICSCLTEEFSTSVSAQIMAQLFLLYKPPEDLTPALGQWTALIKACQGVVSTSEFGLALSKLSRLFLSDGTSNMLSCSKPEAIAKVLKGLFDVSIGSTKSIVIVGGPDCAWFAAVAHWLLELSVEILDSNGDVLYRPGFTTHVSAHTERDHFCFFILVLTILNLVRLGIERIYWALEKNTKDEYQANLPPIHKLLRSWLPVPLLEQALRLYSGRSVDQKSSTMVNACAVAAHGVCVYMNTLTEVTISPERAFSVKIAPGRIQWRNHTYD
ncbi:hypothetical protein IQ07DRAFT_524896, partial [Pyrenochaeta sp. DS3sAY3a]